MCRLIIEKSDKNLRKETKTAKKLQVDLMDACWLIAGLENVECFRIMYRSLRDNYSLFSAKVEKRSRVLTSMVKGLT